MKIFVKTLKGNSFPIDVQPQHTVSDVKKSIESAQGANVYPALQQMLIHQGKVLKDETTLEENNVAENSFVVIMLSKSKSSAGEGSRAAAMNVSKSPSTTGTAATAASVEASATPPALAAAMPPPSSAPIPAPATSPAVALSTAAPVSGDVYGNAASNLVAGSGLDQTIEQILEMGGGMWDRDTVARALHAAFNNPERAVDYLYNGIPEQEAIPPPAQSSVTAPTNASSVPQQPTQPASAPSSGPNANPLDLFPQGLPNVGTDAAAAGALDFLRNNEQFQALRAMVQANPQILQPMLQELGKQNSQLTRLIQDHQNDFVRLMNEPIEEDDEGSVLGQLAAGMPQAIEVTPEERAAIERLEAMGFDQATVLEVFFACNKDEELAANYLLDHMNDYED